MWVTCGFSRVVGLVTFRDGGTSRDTSPADNSSGRDQTSGSQRTEETTMHPTIRYELGQARIADLHQQAHRDALARTARHASRVSGNRSGRRLPALRALLARRVLTGLGPRTSS
jgi:hypothetical protein